MITRSLAVLARSSGEAVITNTDNGVDKVMASTVRGGAPSPLLPIGLVCEVSAHGPTDTITTMEFNRPHDQRELNAPRRVTGVRRTVRRHGVRPVRRCPGMLRQRPVPPRERAALDAEGDLARRASRCTASSASPGRHVLRVRGLPTPPGRTNTASSRGTTTTASRSRR